MIAMALACRPRLIVADEPTTALDVMVQAQVLDVLSGLVHELGVGMLMISHDLSVLADLCDRIVVMYGGRVVEQGPSKLVFGEALHPYADALSAAFPRVGDPAARFAPSGLPGDPPDPADLPPGCAFAPRCPRAIEECTRAVPALRSFGDGPGGRLHPGGEAVTGRLLEARNVSVEFLTRGGHVARALDGVDLQVGAGEVVALVGESGSGKTTVARTMLGLERPVSGEVALRRRAAGLLGPPAARRCGAGCRWCSRTRRVR